MTDNRETDQSIQALEQLLEAERSALLKGDLAALTALLPDKETLVKDLGARLPQDAASLVSLDGKVRRNQLLLDGALEGIREVAMRIAELRRMRRGIETYGSDGQRRNIEVNVDRSLEKRA